MADLSTLDTTQPPDAQQVSQGAARIRETRVATVTSFGIEHALTGEHKIPVGNTASRPAAGHTGRLYINTDFDNLLQWDNGSAWVGIAAVLANAFGVFVANTTIGGASTTLPSGTPTTVLTMSITPDISRFVWVTSSMAASIGGTSSVTYTHQLDATQDQRNKTTPSAALFDNVGFSSFFPAVSASAHTLSLILTANGATGSVHNVSMVAVVF